MEVKSIRVKNKKTIALVAHDHKKKDLLAWVRKHEDKLRGHNFIGTGTTAALISQETSLDVNRLVSGPLGGDQQLGAKISDSQIDILIFFGILLKPNLMTQMSRLFLGYQLSTILPLPHLQLLPTTSCRHQCLMASTM